MGRLGNGIAAQVRRGATQNLTDMINKTADLDDEEATHSKKVGGQRRALGPMMSDQNMPQMDAWFGFCKMDGRGVNHEALRDFLNGEDAPAKGKDVICLYLVDVLVNKQTLPNLCGLLRRIIDDPDDYVLNEDDPELKTRYFPAQLTKICSATGEKYYSALYVGVHKRNTRVGDFSFADTFL